jgi:hypothetical protein
MVIEGGFSISGSQEASRWTDFMLSGKGNCLSEQVVERATLAEVHLDVEVAFLLPGSVLAHDVAVGRREHNAPSEMRILSMAAKKGSNVLLCMPNRTSCILFSDARRPMEHNAPHRHVAVLLTKCPILHAK